MPLVSVVIPTFGRPALVTRAVRSVLAQTLADIEVIVVVDGDDPPTFAALDAIADPRVRYIAHEAKRGAGPARDTGADAGTGKWVAFLDDDDEWLPEKLERQVAACPDPDTVSMTLSRVVTPVGTFVRPADPYAHRQPLDEWLFGRRSWFGGGQSMLQTSSLMFPRAMFDRLHFRDTRQHEEWELAIRAVKQFGYSFVTVLEPLVIYYTGDAKPSLSKTYTWGRSIDWIESMRDVVTPEAYSGFCLTVVTQGLNGADRNQAFRALLRAAMKHGRPTPRQLFAFAGIWALPDTVRRRTRGLLAARRARKPAAADA